MAIRFASKDPSPEPSKPKKQAAPAQATPRPETADKMDEAGDAVSPPVPAAGDLFGTDPKKPRGRKAK